MKIPWDKEKTSKTISYCIVVFWGVLIYFLFDRSSLIASKISWFLSLLTPFFVGFGLAYFLNPLVTLFETKVLKFFDIGRERPKLRRGLSIFICLIITILFFVFLFFMFIPQLIDSIVQFFNDFPTYAKQLTEFAKSLLTRYHIDSGYMKSLSLTTDRIIELGTKMFSNAVPAVLNYSARAASFIVNIIVGMVISVYFLIGKETFLAQVKKIIYIWFPKHSADRIIEVSQLIHKTFLSFIIGKLLDSLVVGSLCFIGLLLLDMPNALLIAVIIGVANIIPFFGPYAGAFISTVLVLLFIPRKIIWFWAFIFILQQIDANIIDPRISGKQTGVPPVWVIFALLVGGGLFGIVGLLISVPVFAVIIVLFRGYAEKKLEQKGMPTKTSAYYRKGKIKAEEERTD
ncbi:MAG: AI-2E family transporter [Bacillota bacterium]|nr:AI-2E family transporter [Bacillota bacterium]